MLGAIFSLPHVAQCGARSMLCSLRVENFAVIEQVEIEFGPALNVITGETGAGKSLLVEAMMAVLGERASSDSVRSGARRAVIEATFNVEGNQHVQRLLTEHDYQNAEPSILILRREIGQSSSRAFINDSPAPLSWFGNLETSWLTSMGSTSINLS